MINNKKNKIRHRLLVLKYFLISVFLVYNLYVLLFQIIDFMKVYENVHNTKLRFGTKLSLLNLRSSILDSSVGKSLQTENLHHNGQILITYQPHALHFKHANARQSASLKIVLVLYTKSVVCLCVVAQMKIATIC